MFNDQLQGAHRQRYYPYAKCRLVRNVVLSNKEGFSLGWLMGMRKGEYRVHRLSDHAQCWWKKRECEVIQEDSVGRK